MTAIGEPIRKGTAIPDRSPVPVRVPQKEPVKTPEKEPEEVPA